MLKAVKVIIGICLSLLFLTGYGVHQNAQRQGLLTGVTDTSVHYVPYDASDLYHPYQTVFYIPFTREDSYFQSVYITPPPPVSYKTMLMGDWGGYRKKLADDGLIIQLSYTNNLLGNPWGGVKQGFAYDDSSGLNFLFDLGKIMYLKGLSFYLTFVQRNGESLSGKYIGNLFPVSQIFGGENFRLDNMNFRWVSLGKRADISFGRLNAGDYFLQSPFYYSYVSNAYDGNPIGVFFNVPFSAYPNSQWATYFKFRPSDVLLAKFGVFNTNIYASQNKYHGTNFSFQGQNGVMLITEWDLLNNKSLCLFSCRLPGRYTVGFMYYTGSLQKNFMTGQHVKGNYGVYYQLEQKLYQPGANGYRGLSAFFVMELFPDAYNRIPLFYDMGIIYRGLFASRPRDFIALGFAYGKFSNNLAASEVAKGKLAQNYEANVELNYCIYVTPWFSIQPDVQYIIKPNGYAKIPNAWVFGTQMSLNF